jgi:hypothetical protein
MHIHFEDYKNFRHFLVAFAASFPSITVAIAGGMMNAINIFFENLKIFISELDNYNARHLQLYTDAISA